MNTHTAEELYKAALKDEGIAELDPEKAVKFLHACKYVIHDNPENTLAQNILLACIYLEMITTNPDMKFPLNQNERHAD